MLSCLKLARKTTKDRRVGSSLLTRLFTAKAPTFFPALTERAGDFRSTFLPPKLPFATAAPLTVACRAGDFRSTFLPRELQRFFPLSPSGPRTFVRLFYRASSHVLSRSRRSFPLSSERAGDFGSTPTFLPRKLPFATAAPLTVACRAGDFRSTPYPTPGIFAKRVRKGMKAEQLIHRAVQKSEESGEQKEVKDAKRRRGAWGDSLHTGPPTF